MAVAAAGCDGGSEPASSPPPASSADEDGPAAGARFPGDPGDGRLYLGASLPISTPAAARPALGGARMGMTRRFYRAHQIEVMREALTTDVAAGILPFASFKAPDEWDAMADGRQDRWLAHLAEAAASLDAPVFLALHHEPENDVDDLRHTPAVWRAMQERFMRMMRDAPLVTPVPVLMRWTFDPRSGRDVEEWLVDGTVVQGIDLYNSWEPNNSAEWNTFSQLWDPIRERLPPGPCVIPELGSSSDPFDPSRQSLWLAEAVEVAAATDVAGMTWFESSVERREGRFRLDREGRAEFRRQLESPEVIRVADAVG